MTAMYGPPLAQAPSTGFNSDFLSKMMGFSFLASVVGGGAGHVGMAGGPTNPYGYFWDSIRLFILGLVIETGRRFFRWVVDRVRFRECRDRHSSSDEIIDVRSQSMQFKPHSSEATQRLSGSLFSL